MTATPGEGSEQDVPQDAGAEIGMVEGEGSTFEPEEDPPEE